MLQGIKTTTIAKRKISNNVAAYLFILPALICIGIFLIYAAGRLFYFSFTSANFSGYAFRFVGLKNYTALLRNTTFHRAIVSTLIFLAVALPLQMGLALFMAVQVIKAIRATTFFRTVFFLPVVMPFVATSLMWKQLFDRDIGLVNNLMAMLQLPRLDFLSNINLALWSILFVFVWKNFGYYMMIYISGLKDVPKELYESAYLDGANSVQRFFYITFPCVKRTTLFVMVLGSINTIVKSFVPTYIMTSGGPRYSTTTMVYYIWKEAFGLQQIGSAAAASMVLFAIIMLITVLQFRFAGEK